MPEVSRRTVLGTSAGVAALLALDGASGPGSPFAAATAAPADAAIPPLPTIVRSHYASSVGRSFVARANAADRHVRLVRIDGDPADDLRFTLVFAPRHGRLPEAIYHLDRAGVPSHALLLNSLGTDGRLQAVVDRSV
ncbi:MAG: hypothetical protein JWO46_2337 [Nocardioidaceae bacterium]|nr:hypothetical protein [Nocardioidaceae bacterium]